MKHFIIIASLFFCFVMPVAAQEIGITRVTYKLVESESPVVYGGYEFDGKYYRYDLKMADFDGAPKWDPSNSISPLSTNEVYTVATRELRDIVGDTGKWTVYDIQLSKLPRVDDQWYFEVKYLYAQANTPSKTFGIIVRLDGKAIRPILTPQSKEEKP